MRRGLDFLTSSERRTHRCAVNTLIEEFDAARALETGEARNGGILKIVLFAAYAFSTPGESARQANDKRSGFDLLVIVEDKRFSDRDTYWSRAEDRLMRRTGIINRFAVPVRFIVHSIEGVDESLSRGSSFFGAIARDGVVLFESDERPLRAPACNPLEPAPTAAIQAFDECCSSAAHLRQEANYAVRDEDYRLTAVLLHQAADRLYRCVLLVAAGYAPQTQDLGLLRSLAESAEPRLGPVWPSHRRGDRAIFAKLKNANAKARSAGDYDITEEELAWMAAQIDRLARVVRAVCSERIAMLEAEALQE